MIPFKTSKVFEHNYNYPQGKTLSINQGGTSSGKTYSILQVLFIKLFEYPKTKALTIGQDIPNLKEGALYDAEQIVDTSEFIRSILLHFNKSDREYYFANGSRLKFTSFKNGQDAKNGKREFSFFNEINGISYNVFKEIYQRTSMHTWCDFNPTSEFWMHEKAIINRPKSRFIKSTYKNNPFVSEIIKEQILSYEPTAENQKNNTADQYLWDVYGLGNMGILEGVLFPKNELNYYDPKSIKIEDIEHFFAYVDIADTGEDDHCCIVSGNIGASIYILDIVYTKKSVEDNLKMTAELLNKYTPEYCQVEINMGGTMYPILLRKLLTKTTILPIRSKTNKKTRIYSISSQIKKYCYFCNDYNEKDGYKPFMKNLFEYKKDGSSKHDDAPDSIAGLTTYITKHLNHLY